MKIRFFLSVWILLFPVGLSADGNFDVGEKLAKAARTQIGKTVHYDSVYRSIPFPGGDVPIETGVCADVVIRAFRAGLGLDLQQLINADMRRDFHAYPNRWGLKSPDPNIDHRRVLNLQVYLRRKGYSV